MLSKGLLDVGSLAQASEHERKDAPLYIGRGSGAVIYTDSRFIAKSFCTICSLYSNLLLMFHKDSS